MGVRDLKVAPIETDLDVADAQHVEEVKALAGKLGMDATTLTKGVQVFGKAESLEALTADGAPAFITALTARVAEAAKAAVAPAVVAAPAAQLDPEAEAAATIESLYSPAA